LLDQVSAEKEALRRQMPSGRNLEARLCTAALLELRSGAMKDVANGLLAAFAEDPALLEPVREAFRETLVKLKDTSEDLDACLLAWLAVEGLCSFEIHGLSPFSRADRERIGTAIARLIE